ncbi:MAG: hypothetical protein ACREH4_12920, partial [Vitreimonas sp.]
DRLGAMLGMSPPAIERLAPPETCGEAGCIWSANSVTIVLARAPPALTCRQGAIVITSLTPPADYAARCVPLALIDAQSVAAHGGGLIYREVDGVRIERAQLAGVRRAWTPRVESLDQE